MQNADRAVYYTNTDCLGNWEKEELNCEGCRVLKVKINWFGFLGNSELMCTVKRRLLG